MSDEAEGRAVAGGLQELARRIEQPVNSQFSPDFGGNPALRAELANGLDLTYEHFWAPGAVFSVNASARQIEDYIRARLDQDVPLVGTRSVFDEVAEGLGELGQLVADYHHAAVTVSISPIL